jgi:cytochrome c peroxidase
MLSWEGVSFTVILSKMKVNFVFPVALLLVLASCEKDPSLISNEEILRVHLNLPTKVANYASPDLPDFFSNQFIAIQNNTPATNPTTDWGATLGRVLFYDKQLSKNNTIACASCHQQAFGFVDTAQLSIGFNGGSTNRHSMALGNATYYANGRFFWDERAATLEEQVLQPIQDQVEMGMTMPEVIQRLQTSPFYPILFKKAFGTEEINNQKVAAALAQFVRSMVSYDSKYDQGRTLVSNRIVDFPNFNATENAGKKIFMTHAKINCFGCHNTDVFITDNARNNGLTAFNLDDGSYIHTKDELDKGKFKTPSLKNVAVRGRFMHDGRFTSLEQVIQHYNTGIQPNRNLDPHLIDVTTGSPLQMGLSPIEVQQLEAFLHTLTDNAFLQDNKYSNPFK